MTDTNPVPFWMILLAIGEVLKTDEIVTPAKIQNLIAKDESFGGIRIPLNECRMALSLMESSEFIKYIDTDEYVKKTYTEIISKIPAFGDLFTLNEFTYNCFRGLFIDNDGSGYYSDGNIYYHNRPAYPSEIVTGNADKNYTHVIWFNK